MMGESAERSSLPWAGLVVLVMGGYVYWAAQAPLKSSRPELEGLASPSEVARNSVPARLWEDPLIPAQRDYESRASKEAVLSEKVSSDPEKKKTPRQRTFDAVESEQKVFVQQRILDFAKSSTPGLSQTPTTLILPVFLDSQPYAESTESRIRCRYAVVSALGATGFVPKENDRIRYWVSRPGGTSERSSEFLVPFEWFEKDRGSPVGTPVRSDYSEVMVLWIPENRLGDSPLEDLKQVVQGIVNTTVLDHRSQASYMFPRHDVRVIGPTGSALLPKFIEGVTRISPEGGAKWKLFSDRATLSKTTLKRRLDVLSVPEKSQEPALLERTIGTDLDLAHAILKELDLRRASPLDPRNHVVLVAEWDTDYARAWEEAFQEALKHKASQSGGSPTAGNTLHMFSYLRGVDGRLPRDGKPEPRSKKEGDKSVDAEPSEGPEGNSQIDYVRRTEGRIRNLEYWLKSTDAGSIQAIGVVGSDVYDKIVFLRALRQAFPNVLFFTSDLDARLFDRNELEWTRNLLVASHFGLQLSDDLQGKVLPFRDSYQTSTYHACLRALQTEEDKTRNPQLPETHVYEIARGGPFDLSGGTRSPLHPKSERGTTKTDVFKKDLFLPHAGAVLFVGLVSLFYRPLASKSFREKRWIVVGILVATSYVVFLFAVASDASNSEGEPLLLTGGISGWPSQFLRAVAIVVSWWFIFTASDKLSRNAELVESTFEGLKPGQNEGSQGHPWIATWNEPLETGPLEGKLSMRKLWLGYLKKLETPSRTVRCFVLLGLFVLLGCVIVRLDDWPLQPLRGPLSYQVNGWMLAIAGFSLAALLARTIDSTRACVRLIQQISEYPIHWPEKAPEKPHENAPEVAAERVKDTDPAMSELLGIRLIALRTEAVEKLMYPPCLVVCLLLLAQSQYLDRWGWSIPVLATFGLMLLSAIYCGVLLRYWAERARRAALQDVQEELIRESSKKEAKPELLKAVIEEISSTRRGAFSPIQENPLLHAVLIPFGGVGVIELAKTILLH